MILNYIITFLQSRELLLLIELFSCAIKIYIFFSLIFKSTRFAKVQKHLLLLLTVLVCSILVDISWISGLIPKIWFPFIDFRRHSVFIIRVAWAGHYLLFLSLGFFLESLCEANYYLKTRQKIALVGGLPWMIYFLSIAFINFKITNMNDRPTERLILQLGTLLIPIFLVIPSLFLTINQIKSNQSLPKILKKQLKILIIYLISPYLITQLMDSCSVYYNQPYVIIALSNAFLAWAIYFSISKIMKLRFLNFSENIQSTQKFKFVDHFKNFLASISQAKSLNEINYIIGAFFRESLAIEPNRITIYYRQAAFESPASKSHEHKILSHDEAAVERLINNAVKNEKLLEYMKAQQILLYDEIDFTNFYQKNSIYKDILNFMNEIHANIFHLFMNKII